MLAGAGLPVVAVAALAVVVMVVSVVATEVVASPVALGSALVVAVSVVAGAEVVVKAGLADATGETGDTVAAADATAVMPATVVAVAFEADGEALPPQAARKGSHSINPTAAHHRARLSCFIQEPPKEPAAPSLDDSAAGHPVNERVRLLGLGHILDRRICRARAPVRVQDTEAGALILQVERLTGRDREVQVPDKHTADPRCVVKATP